jgi:acyl transferase domain-containing protein
MSSSERDPVERAVAVVGVGAVLPDAPDAPTFWQNVIAGKNSITDVQDDRWSAADYYDPDPKAPEKTYSKIGGWVRGFKFDPVKFRIPPTMANAMDDGQKWVVTAAQKTLADAGYPDKPLDLERTAVILGNAMGGELHYMTALRVFAPEYVHALENTEEFRRLPEKVRAAMVSQMKGEIAKRLPDISEDSMPGELANIMAGRVSAVFNLRGPNYTTDAACASSLAALDAAIHGLVDHQFDAVMTGGIDHNMGAPTFVKFCKIGALSADGSRPYAKGANGFVMGEGGALFLLKRLGDAEKAGDRIYAVIRAVGASSDGKGKGITAPNPIGQILAMQRGWARAGLSPSTVSLVEGHGTSTKVGDVVEVESLAKVIAPSGLPKRSIALGSVKSQIGHLKSGAGAAGLLKAVYALHHKVLPPSINFGEPNPDIAFDQTPFFVSGKAQPWERPSCGVRRAGLSAFGFGGTNFHIVLEEHVPGSLTARRPVVQVGADVSSSEAGGGFSVANAPSPLGDLLAVGAADARGLRSELERAMGEAKAGKTPRRAPPSPEVMGAAERVIMSFDTAEDLASKCERALKALDKNEGRAWRLLQPKGIYKGKGPAPKVAFMFPGQGSQYVNMLADLRRADPVVAETFLEADAVMTPLLGRPLTSYLFCDSKDEGAIAKAEDALRDTTICQPAVLACDVAITRLLAKHGVVPDIAMGHSLGEWGAVVASGMASFQDALMAVSARAKGMAAVAPPDPGKMASVLGPYEETVKLLKGVEGYVVAANLNSLNQTVIAGESAAVVRAVEMYNKAGMTAQTIPVSHAFHSKIVGAASVALRRVVGEMKLHTPKIKIVGNVEGELYPSDVEKAKDLIAMQLASPVQFVKGLETCYREGARIFVEVGPKRVLQGFAENVLGDREGVVCFSTNHPKRGDRGSFHDAMVGLYAAGMPRVAAVTGRIERPAPAPYVVQGAPAVAAPAPARAVRAAGEAPDYLALGKLFAKFLDDGMAIHRGGEAAGEQPAPVIGAKPVVQGSVVVSGAGLGVPGQSGRVFDDSNFDRVLRGESFIEKIPESQRQLMLEKNVVRLVKRETGEPSFEPIASTAEVLRLAARRGAFDLVQEFGIKAERVDSYDIATSLAIAAGIEALRDAGIPLVRNYRRTTTGSLLPDKWMLPRALADETGVIFASAFPGVNRLVDELERFHSDAFRHELLNELEGLRKQASAPDAARLGKRIDELKSEIARNGYVFDRRFLFRILAMGHSQFAELLGIRGPNTQVNSACASTTQAVAIAEDWIRAGRCRRVVVIGSDDVTSDKLLPWIGSGFLASGAATTEEVLEKAALPFDRRRHGMLLGMGACALVIEAQDALVERGMRGITEVLGTEMANSAFHGTRLDVEHIVGVMERLVSTAERKHGLARSAMARELVFISHETYTPARGGSAAAEVMALRRAFGGMADSIVIANTKGFTGHPMGVGIEDAVAVKILEKGIVPPVPNFKEPDPELGALNLSKGGRYPVKYALRLAAGFGSQLSMTLSRRVEGVEERVAAQGTYQRWLAAVSGYPQASLEVDHRTLRVKDSGAPAHEPSSSTWVMGTPPQAFVLGAPGAAAPEAKAPASSSSPVVHSSVQPSVHPERSEAQSRDAASAVDPVAEQVLALVSQKTGYPRDMLALDLDLEADLGIDTVKQAEVFSMVREHFAIPRNDNIKLREYPTLKHVIGFVRTNRPDLAAAPSVAAAPAAAVATTAFAAFAGGLDPVGEKVLELVSQKTGYPRDMLALDLDLEADLGIDTVKQAEVFSMVREHFAIPRNDNIKLREYPTLKHVIGFVRTNRPDLAAAPVAPAPAPIAPIAPVAAPVARATAPAAAGLDVVAEKVLELVSQKTGYPRDMLELDLDLEADLGIDTVKQAEVFGMVREHFAIPRNDNIKLREYPTLKHVIGFVRTNRPDLAAAPSMPAQAAPAPASAPAAVTVVAAGGLDPVAEKVLELVAQKTGYPRDMLELDLDLEADLGIDTVKQAEVFGMVREHFAIPRNDNIKLREYPTLKHVIGFVRTNRPDLGGAPAAAAPAVAAPAAAFSGAEASAPAGDRSVLFRVPVAVLRPSLELCKKTHVQLQKGGRVVVVADKGGAGASLAKALERKGLEVLRIDDRPEPRAFEARIAEWAKAGNVAGAYFLAGLDPESPMADLDLAGWRKLHGERTKLLHALSRALYDSLAVKGTFLVAATRLGGVHGYEAGGAKSPAGGAVTGFVKALARERTEALVKAVDFSESAAVEAVAGALLAETERDSGAVEVGHKDGQRYGIAVVAEELGRGPAVPGLVLDSKSVFLVTGGAGAITTVIAQDLATASKGTFHLVDARPVPDDVTKKDLVKFAADKEALKREIFERLKAEGQRATPALVEKRLFDLERAQALLDAMKSIEAAGGKAYFHSADVTDAAVIDGVMKKVKELSGKLDVILHAAGIERSRSLDTKPVEEFDLVFGVKVDGIFNLLKGSKDLGVRGLVCFSSVAGRFGNAGQADYSSGNDLLCKVTQTWTAAAAGRVGVALDWTAWGDIGMATRGNIPDAMKRAGIEMLSSADGIPVVRRMLTQGLAGETVVGRQLGILLQSGDAAGGLDAEALLKGYRSGDKRALAVGELSLDLHQGYKVSVSMDPKAEPFLKDHAIDGTPVLPGVMGLEGFAEVALLVAPGHRLAAIENVRFAAPLKFYRHEPRTATFRALPLRSEGGRVRVLATLTSSQVVVGSSKPAEQKLHFAATLVLEAGSASASAPTVKPASFAKNDTLGRDAIYRVYFHGPAYQVLSTVQRTPGGLAGAIFGELPPDTLAPKNSCVYSPRLIELCFQTAGVWEIGATGQLGLPAAAEKVTVFGLPAENTKLVAEVFPRKGNGGAPGLCFDAHVRDAAGKVYVELKGYTTSQMPGKLPDEQLAPFKNVVA